MPSFRKSLIAFAIFTVLLLGSVIMLTVIVDPFFQYHKPLPGFPYLIDNQISQNPGMAENMEYDSVILGSSMTVNFNTDWFKDLMGLNTIKLSYSAAYPKDQANIMQIVFDSPNQVKKVFLGIDVITYMAGVAETKYPIPEYLYNDKVYDDAEYLLNKDVLLNYILRPIADQEKSDLATIYASWWTEEYYDEAWVLKHYVSPGQVLAETPKDAYTAAVEANLAQNICPFIEANPETDFVIFFPPYSILFWNDVRQENHLEATLEEFRYLCERLGAYENVSLYFFLDQEWIVTDLNNYADYSHYHPDFNRYMAECFANGTCLVEDIGVNLDNMRNIVAQFDFNALLSNSQ